MVPDLSTKTIYAIRVAGRTVPAVLLDTAATYVRDRFPSADRPPFRADPNGALLAAVLEIDRSPFCPADDLTRQYEPRLLDIGLSDVMTRTLPTDPLVTIALIRPASIAGPWDQRLRCPVMLEAS